MAAATFLFAACGNPSSTSTETPAATEAPAEAPTAAPAPAATEAANITLNAGDDMKYDLSEIKVKEGQTVKLTLHHTGKMAADAMGHNFVLLAQGVDLSAFAQAANAAKDNDYIPKDKAADIIAHTKTIGGGETTEITFTAPAKGTYDYLCTFPGHWAMMKGKFIVE